MQSTAQDDELRRLKSLLLRPEKNQLDQVQSDLDKIALRVGSPENLEAATAEILVEAFRRAEGSQHRELANAVAPVVVAAIRAEIKNSKDMMVEALYPITGRLVAAAVSKAFSDLVVNINSKIESLVSSRQLKWRVKAILSRRSLSEVAMAESHRPTLRKLIILERGSGVLSAYWDREPDNSKNPDLISGMIAAITEFSANVFDKQAGELRSLDFGSGRIFLQASARTIVAAEIAGPVTSEDESKLNEYLANLNRSQPDAGAITADQLEAQAATVFPDNDTSNKGPSQKPLWILALLACLALCWFGYKYISQSLIERRVAKALSQVQSQTPHLKAFPLVVGYNHSARQIRLQGLVSSSEDATKLSRAASISGYTITPEIYAVASENETVRRLKSLEVRFLAQLGKMQTLDIVKVRGQVEKLQQKVLAETTLLQKRHTLDSSTIQKRIVNITSAIAALSTEAKKIDSANSKTVNAQKAFSIKIAGLEKRLSAAFKSINLAESAIKSNSDISKLGAKKIDSVTSNTAGIQKAVTARLAELETRLSAANKSLDIARREIRANADINKIYANLISERERQFAKILASSAVRFSTGIKFEDDASVDKMLTGIARLQIQTGLPIRIIGYTDKSGSAKLNKLLSVKRAQTISNLLQNRGVTKANIVAVGSANEAPGSAANGKAGDRIVTFEILNRKNNITP